MWKVYGSFELLKKSEYSWSKQFEFAVQAQFGLLDAGGVYIICTTHGTSHRVRYIGMTHRQGFAKEIFSQANNTKVWSVIETEKCSKITIWLVAKPKVKHSGFAWQKSMENQSYLLETLFIMHAKAAGHNLINIKKMKSADEIAVEGLFGVRKRGKKAKSLLALAKILVMR